MRRPGARCLAPALLPVLLAGRAAAAPPPAGLGERLAALVAGVPERTQVGLLVLEADGGVTWFAHQPDAPLKPASLQKLLVTAAALERFGPGFAFETPACLHGQELWVVGSGDPALGDERIAARHGRGPDHLFDDWAAALRARGVTVLAKIVLDDHVFDDRYRHPDWPDEQAERWYQAPVGGLNLNDNCLDVGLELRDGRVVPRLRPDLPPDLLENSLRPGQRHRPELRRQLGRDVFELRGTVTRSTTLQPVSAGRPPVFFGYALHQALRRRGIEIRGPVVRATLLPEDLAAATPLAVHRTALPDVLWRCNAFSQNLFAECLLKALAAYEPDGTRSGRPGSWEAGRQVLLTTLAGLPLDLSRATVRDGSGLSHRNRATARQLAELLVRMRRHRHADVFVQSLARPGEPGSLRRRFDDPALRGRVQAKTGTLNDVRCLAGYATRGDGTVLAFALLINGPSDAGLPDRVVAALLAPP